MNKHEGFRGFTIVEVLVVVVVIGLLLTIGGLAWFQVRDNALNDEQKNNALLLRDALETYYQDHGEYPKPASCPSLSNNTDDIAECHGGQLAELLVPHYLKTLPKNRAKADFNYLVRRSKDPTAKQDGYAFKLVDGRNAVVCKVIKNVPSRWWYGIKTCDL